MVFGIARRTESLGKSASNSLGPKICPIEFLDAPAPRIAMAAAEAAYEAGKVEKQQFFFE